MKTKILMFAFVIASFFAFTNTTQAQTNPTQNIPVVGTTTGGAFAGTFDIQKFITRAGQVFAVGTLTNTATGIVYQAVQIPVTGATGSCTILTLDLGAVHLDLLGLVVDLAPVHLNITAQSGPGNLLGNLLCAVAHLLDGTGPLSGITGLLNNILAILNG
jgi:hypothetical protein